MSSRKKDDVPSGDKKDSYAGQLSSNVFGGIYGDDPMSPMSDPLSSDSFGSSDYANPSSLGGGLGDD